MTTEEKVLKKTTPKKEAVKNASGYMFKDSFFNKKKTYSDENGIHKTPVDYRRLVINSTEVVAWKGQEIDVEVLEAIKKENGGKIPSCVVKKK